MCVYVSHNTHNCVQLFVIFSSHIIIIILIFFTLRFPELLPRSVLCRASAESDWTIGPAVSAHGSKLGLSNLLPAAFTWYPWSCYYWWCTSVPGHIFRVSIQHTQLKKVKAWSGSFGDDLSRWNKRCWLSFLTPCWLKETCHAKQNLNYLKCTV